MLLALALVLSQVKGDLPINCKKSGGEVTYPGQIWTFHVSVEQDEVNLFEQQEVCTHRLPNKIQIISNNFTFQLPKAQILKIKILDDKNVVAAQCPGTADCIFEREDVWAIKGTWDLLYRESLLVELENGLRFVANLQYKIKPSEESVSRMREQISEAPAYMQSESVFAEIKASNYDSFEMHCNQTMVGFVQKVSGGDTYDKHKIQCFFGILSEQPPKELQEEQQTTVNESKELNETQKQIQEKTQREQDLKKAYSQIGGQDFATAAAQVEDPEDSFVQLQQQQEIKVKKEKKPRKFTSHFEPSPEFDAFILTVNSNPQSTWKADECLLSKSHPKYDRFTCEKKHDEEHPVSNFKKPSNDKLLMVTDDDDDSDNLLHVDDPAKSNKKTQSVAQTTNNKTTATNQTSSPENKEGSKDLTEFSSSEDGSVFKYAFDQVQSWKQKYNTSDQIPHYEIPLSYDLRNVSSIDFTSKVRDQGGCGSCYTFSFLQVVETRLKMKYGKKVPKLSPQQLLSCNYMAEGCEGGWAIMQGFFAENAGITTEECAPYEMQTKNLPCASFANCAPVAKVSKTYKLRKTDEESIMREILLNGPVITDWSAPVFMKTYKSGIMDRDKSSDMDSLMQQENYTPLPNHASVIIGWDAQANEKKDDMVKFWIVRNSFGQKYGMSGDMHIPRGNNTFQIESDIVAVDPELI